MRTKNFPFNIVTALAVILMASGALFGFAPGNDDDDDGGNGNMECEKIKAKFEGEFVTTFPSGAPCASPLGVCLSNTLTGDLKGAAEVTMTSTANELYGEFFTSNAFLLLNDGNTLTTRDIVALDLINGTGVVNVTITGGTGDFAGATGRLTSAATFDPSTGILSGKLRGKICTPDD